MPEFIRHFSVQSVTVHCDSPSPVNLDGEMRMAKDIHISVAEEKVRFFHPKGVQVKAIAQPAAVSPG